MFGSSPRMWGTRRCRCAAWWSVRFIPTHVGNTEGSQSAAVGQCGSSPRMWGTPMHAGAHPWRRRFIPTHVGNTPVAAPSRSTRSVHPHACGEHESPIFRFVIDDGSSPRMWGTLAHLQRRTAVRRFIPTHVGNTSSSAPRCGTLSVHPHACGEHTQISCTTAKHAGSSPRMWGTHAGRYCRLAIDRFIPTHVGNTGATTRRPGVASVHPHACGEHLPLVTAVVSATGSSPRMWGTPPQLTPSRRTGAVHPHACGEHLGNQLPGTTKDGSSPRMWGTRLRGV